MARYRATLAYDGTAYLGFQRQANATPTVQRAVEEAIGAVTAGERVTVIAAGRTDTGVHAAGQVIAFDVDWSHADEALLRAVNAHLPADIALQDIRQQVGFHPRFDALSRRYRYHVVQSARPQPLLRNLAWQVRHRLDLERMQTAAKMLIGSQDFAAFGTPPQGSSTVREVIVSRWDEQTQPCGALLVYTIEANAFLYRMVRRIVGTLVEVGRSALSLEEFAELLRRADLSLVKITAPPQGLILERVRYPGDDDEGGAGEITAETGASSLRIGR
jgi:tRNA pseudouridine38-40 synthase